MQRADARVAQPAEDELARDAGGDHLVVDQVGRQPAQRQVAPPLADDLVAGGKADEVREALDRDRVAVAHELGDRVAHRRDLRGRTSCTATAVRLVERGDRSAVDLAVVDLLPLLGALEGAARVARHLVDGLAEDPDCGVDIALVDDERRREPDDVVARLQDEQAALEARPLDGLGRVARVELDADHQALAAHVAHQVRLAIDQRPQAGDRLARRAARRCR